MERPALDLLDGRPQGAPPHSHSAPVPTMYDTNVVRT